MGVEPADCNKLYIRLPVKIIDEFQIRQLHQNIIQVHLPRQKSRRWCIVDFESKEKLQEAVTGLKKTRLNNKLIKISPYTKGEKKGKKPKKPVDSSSKPLLKLLKKSS